MVTQVQFPLVVETLGLWSSNSLKVLRSIASKASTLSGISRGQAINNLLQQLSGSSTLDFQRTHGALQNRVGGNGCQGLAFAYY